MQNENKKNFSQQEIKEALEISDITLEQETNKLDESYICERIIMNTQNGHYTYSNSNIYDFLTVLGIDSTKVLNCNYRLDFKELFIKEINILIPEDKGSNKPSFFSRFKTQYHTKNEIIFEGYDVPSDFSEAVTLYNDILGNKNIEPINESCDVRRDNKVYFTNGFGKRTGVAITRSDEIWILPPLSLNTEFFMVISLHTGKPIIWGNFIREKDHYYLAALSKNIRVDIQETNINYKIIFANETFTRFFSKDIKINITSLPIVDEVLCIDFGTSNTTAGTWIRTEYGPKPELVKFDDITNPAKESSYFLPTIVYLYDLCSDENKFLFGYEAKKHIIDNNYELAGTIFYNIKQWIVSEDNFKIMEGTDEKGEECSNYNLFAKDIIVEYIKYVISVAEIKLKRRCRKLHFSAPVKCKELFNDFITEKFKCFSNEYEILPADQSLDEAIAIIYKRISEFRKEFEYGRREADGELMVIDCGGGTTDAANCSYHFSLTDTGTKIDITTKFENGQSALGGNDLTYRIFQFLKIRIKDYYCNTDNKISTAEIINNLEIYHKFDESTGKLTNETEDYLSHIDMCIQKKRRFDCYDQLDQKSKDAEWVIPTDFNNTDIIGTGVNNSRMARHNFNYLWQLAEQWKIALYSENATFSIDFNNKSKALHLEPESTNIYFYINKNLNNKTDNLQLDKVDGIPDISLNREELIALLKPQIYYLLSVMFLKADGTERSSYELPSRYRKLHLSGQSCRINIFQDMLKEFVPGKSLRGGTKIETAEEKKRACVEGCIQYLSDKAYGKISSTIRTEMPNIIYKVNVDKDSLTSKMLFDGGKISVQENKVYMPEITIYRREITPGWIHLTVSNNLVQNSSADYRKDIMIQSHFPEGRDIENIEEFKKEILEHAPENFAQWNITDDTTTVLDRLIETLNYESIDKLLIFVVPNNNGFSFTLWQIIKYIQNGKGDNINTEKIRIMGKDNLQYEKITFTTRFDGINCK